MWAAVEVVAAPLDKATFPSPGISYVAPHLNNLYFLPLCRRWGVYAVVRGLFLLKLGLSLLMLLAGPDHPGLLCLFIASNRVFTEVWKLCTPAALRSAF